MSGRRRKQLFCLASLVTILISTALHLPCLRGEAVIDDKRLISDYEGRGCGANPADCFGNMMFGFYYRPVLAASIAIGQKLHDNRPVWFHAENLVLHAAAVALALWFFSLLFKRHATALAAGLFYAFHPIQVCFTTFIGGRDESLVAIGILLFAIGVRCAARRMALLRRIGGAAARARIGAWITVSIIGLLVAEFSKEQVTPLILLAPLLALPLRGRTVTLKIAKRGRRPRPSVPSRVPLWTLIYLLPTAVFALAAHNALHDIDFVDAKWPPGLHIEMVGRTLWSYTRIYLFPSVNTLHLTTLGAWQPAQVGIALLGWLAAGIWLALLAANRRNRPRLILMLWASLGLFSCLNVIPVPTQFASAYRAGIPLIGFAGMGASLLFPDVRRRTFPTVYQYTAPLAVCAIVLWGAIVTVRDVPNWHDEYRLMRAEVAADPNFVCSRAALASFDDQYGHYTDALRQLTMCMDELFGASTPPENYPEMVRSEAMIPALQSASTLRYYRPWQYIPQLIRERGRTLLLMRRPADALPDLRAALQLEQADLSARGLLEQCYRDMHQDGKADAVHRMDDVLRGRRL